MGFRDLYTLQGTFWVPQGLGEGVSGAVAPPIPEKYLNNEITNLPSLFIQQFCPERMSRKKERSLQAENPKKKQLKKYQQMKQPKDQLLMKNLIQVRLIQNYFFVTFVTKNIKYIFI